MSRARTGGFLKQLVAMFVVVLACSFGYLLTMLYWGVQYETTTLRDFGRLSDSARIWITGSKWVATRRSEPRNKPVEWKLFGEEFMSDSELNAIRHVQREGDNGTGAQHLSGGLLRLIKRSPETIAGRTRPSSSAKGQLKTVSDRFQLSLETSWPLNCHSGQEGLFPMRYERLAKALQDYAFYHKKTSPQLSTNGSYEARVLVWQCSVLDYCGGIADRMKGLTYSLLLAIFSRRRLIVSWDDTYLETNLIDWKDDKVYGILKSVNNHSFYEFNQSSVLWSNSNSKKYEDQQAYEGNWDKAENIDMDEYSLADVVRAELYSKLESLSEYPYEFKMFSILGGTGIDNSEDDIIYKLSTIGGDAKYVFFSTNLEPSTLKDTYKNGNQEWIQSGLKWVGLDHLTEEEVDRVMGIAMRYLFRVKDTLLQELDRAGRTLALKRRPYSSVHIRTGFAGSAESHESIQLPKFVRHKQTWASMLECAVKTADSFLGPASPILLATDSRIVKHMAVSKYGGRFRTLDNTVVHIDKMAKLPHALQEGEIEGLVLTWVDMLLLSEAHVQVGGTSGYIWASSLFCYLPRQRRINAETCAGSRY